MDSVWFRGPDFLWCESALSEMLRESMATEYTIDSADPEVKATTLATTSVVNPIKTSPSSLAQKLDRFSKLEQAIKAVATLQNIVKSKISKIPRGLLAVADLEKARFTIIKWVQSSMSDYLKVKQGKLEKKSPLNKLDPFIDPDGILRIGGRLQSSDLSYNEAHPVVIPKASRLAKLIIDWCHRKTIHQGKGMTLAELRSSGYWVIGSNRLVTTHIHNCITCRRQRRPTETQQMAPLPSERTSVTAPFTYVGCDCFGPFLVKDGRKEVKRYGLILTCMSSRAVHLELLDDLSTDSFINGLRCFMAIRGPIRQLQTDRGTNFVGAAKELAKALEEDSQKLRYFSQENHFDFVFNPPHSSHMGGVWERQIRSVRSVLNVILSQHKSRMNTTTLRTFLYEVMAIINSRPLDLLRNNDTSVPLSPNQLLTMKSKVLSPLPGKFDNHNLYSRKRWRQVQSLANAFWSRWKSEYLQSLQYRQKWNQPKPDVEEGDIVIVKDDSCVRNQWPLAQVAETTAGRDGRIRKIKVRMADSNLDAKGQPASPPRYLERPVTAVVVIQKAHA